MITLELTKFLPIGSVVEVNGSNFFLLIVQRAVMIEGQYRDYGAFHYNNEDELLPSTIYFNQRDIVAVHYLGYQSTNEVGVVRDMHQSQAQLNSISVSEASEEEI